MFLVKLNMDDWDFNIFVIMEATILILKKLTAPKWLKFLLSSKVPKSRKIQNLKNGGKI